MINSAASIQDILVDIKDKVLDLVDAERVTIFALDTKNQELFSMANQIAEGYILLSTNTLRGFAPGELMSLRAELEKLQRDARAIVPPQDDALAQQARNRKIARLSSALQVIINKLTTR